MKENRSRPPRLLFCSYHGYVDPSSGAAISLRDLLTLLGRRGWHCGVLCGPRLDFESPRSVESVLRQEGLRYVSSECAAGPAPFRVGELLRDGVPVTVYEPASNEWPCAPKAGYGFLALLERMLARWRPDVVLTYGGTWIGRAIIACSKARGAKTVFWLRNCSYQDVGFFEPVDAVLVPCEFSRGYYRRTLGLASTAIASPVIASRVRCENVAPRYLTYVNPQPSKGVFVFARIAQELSRVRPDIPMLVVEGRGSAECLTRAGLDLSEVNLRVMGNTTDPREFYGVSRAVVMPSLWDETFARVPVEAFINGIPVLATRRGGLPENLARAGFLFDLPEVYTGESRRLPTAQEVEPWVRTIVRLWDDADFYARERGRCLAAAEEFDESRLGLRYDSFFREVASRPGQSDLDDNDDILGVVRDSMDGGTARRCGELTATVLDELSSVLA